MNTKMKQIRVAILGQGRSGRDIHGLHLKKDTERFKVAAVVEPFDVRRERAASEYPGCDTYSDYRALLERKDIDLVVNATPSYLHFPITKEFLSAGFNVLTEKPFVPTVVECDELTALAKEKGVHMLVFQQSRFANYFQKVKEIIAGGNLGRIAHISIQFNGFARRWDWQCCLDFNGGNLANTGPHPLDQALNLMDNYGEMFRILANMWVPLSRYLFNTLFIAVLGTGLHVLVAGMAAYPLAKHNFPGRNLIFGVIMLGLLFVNQVTFVPSFVIIAKLDILNTYLAYLLPTIGVSLGLFLMRQFISQLPDSMLEAAKIDGANEHRVFFSIVFPSIKPAVITVIIFQFINLWNGLPSDVVYNEEFKSLTQAMSQITAANAYARYGPSMAASVIMMIPPIVIFVSLQSKVIETMTSAGIKG